MSPASRKRGLGKGLDALLPSKGASAKFSGGSGDLQQLKVGDLIPNRFQPRTYFDDAKLEDLANSIAAQGVIQPIVVAPQADGRYAIIAGERRWRASKMAGLKVVPVVIREVGTDQELLELALVENIQRADLNAMEEAEAYQALRESFGLSQGELAKRVGKSRTAVTNSLRLLRLEAEVQDLLRDGSLLAGQARPLVGLKRKDQVRLSARAVKDGLTARDLEAMAKAMAEAGSSKKKSGKKDPRNVHDAAAAEKLTQRLQTKVVIKRRGGKGVVQVHFHSEEELMRIYDHLS